MPLVPPGRLSASTAVLPFGRTAPAPWLPLHFRPPASLRPLPGSGRPPPCVRSRAPLASPRPAHRVFLGIHRNQYRSAPGRLVAKFVCRRAKNAGYEDYKFPDPIPEFAEQETSKFREHMAWRLEQKKDYFGDHVEEIVDICTEILGTFLENDYCGPGTLLVHPFLDIKGEIKQRGFPGAPQAARAAIAWAEKNIDKDWKAWTGEY